MSSFIRVFAFLVLNSILAHARPQDLFTLDSPQFNLDAPYNDASSLLNSNDVTSDSTSLFLDPLDQGIDFSSDMDSFGNSNNLFASNSMDLTALPSCKSEGSQTDSSLQARDGSCQPQETINLPTELFQDPFKFLRDNIGTPLRGQIRRPGQGDQKDENTNLIFFTSPFKDDEEACPTYFFGPSNIPVCQNPLTGHAEREVASNAKRLYNIISYPPICPPFSKLLCCATVTNREFHPDEAIYSSLFNQEENEFLSRLSNVAWDGRFCWWRDMVLMMGVPVDELEPRGR